MHRLLKKCVNVGSIFDLGHLGGHRPGLSSHPLLVFGPVLAVACVRLRLSRVFDVGIIEKVLDAEEQLLDRDRGPPILLLVEQREADCSRGVYVGVEQRGDKLHLRRSRGEIVLEDDLTFVETALPGSSFLAGDSEPVKRSTIC